FQGVVDLLTLKSYTGEKDDEADVPSELQDSANSYRERLIEAIAENDDDLLNKFLEGTELSDEELRKGLRAAVVSGSLVPILVGSATKNLGITALMDMIVTCLPSPVDAGPV